MIKNTIILALSSCALNSMSAAVAQEVTARPDAVEAYLDEKAEEFRDNDVAATKQNKGGAVTSLYNLLRTKGSFKDGKVQGKNAYQKERVADALVKTVAYYLASVGITPSEVNRLERGGLDPLAAGTAVISGQSTFEDKIIVSEIVLVAEVTANASLDSGITHKIDFQPVQTLKGVSTDAQLELTVRAPNGLVKAKQGEKYLLFLSRDLTAFRADAKRVTSSTEPTLQFPAYLIQDGKLIATEFVLDKDDSSLSKIVSFATVNATALNKPGNGGKIK